MQFSFNLASLALVALALTGAGSSTLVAYNEDGAATAGGDEPATYLVSHEQMMHWIATTSAELTFIGEPLNPLAPRSAQQTSVTYCSERSGSFCGGSCTVYNGGPTCLNAPDTSCLAASNNVVFCSSPGCGGACNQLASCGTRLANGFCFTPDTKSILVTV
ncbi:hypothetical protein PsYK624_131160 [Phanerochaete sordida]|uniref:Uncharacterized protein n=1 Tax=Phanerochaete sordida TaxID=48140 RepID=A0A9P3GL34_9APHY|nr:hypothetical protein PsYK624_131160 [Phanerochaete sordida]